MLKIDRIDGQGMNIAVVDECGAVLAKFSRLEAAKAYVAQAEAEEEKQRSADSYFLREEMALEEAALEAAEKAAEEKMEREWQQQVDNMNEELERLLECRRKVRG